MDKPSLGFVGIFVPRDLWLMNNLSVTEKVLAAVIDALDQGEGAWPSNAYLADTLGLGERQIRDYLTRLEAAGVVRRTAVDGQRRLFTVYSGALRSLISGSTEGAAENRLPPRQETATNSVKDRVSKNKNTSALEACVAVWGDDLDEEGRNSVNEFIAHRQSLKRPMSHAALVKNLAVVKAEAEKHKEPVSKILKEMVDTTIKNGWYGLFPVRRQSGYGQRTATAPEAHRDGF